MEELDRLRYHRGLAPGRRRTGREGQTLRAFLHWAITTGNGPAYLSKVSFQALPSSVASISQALIGKIS